MQDVNLDQLERSDYLTTDAKNVMRERATLWVQAEIDEGVQAQILAMCREGTDFYPPYLFFLRMFGWIFEPRNPFGFKKLPFVPFEYQERELKIIHEAVIAGEGVLGKKIIKLWLKSRDMGLTWLVIAYFVWHALFRMGHFHCGSRNAAEVDTKGDVRTIFYKIRYLVNNLPFWMLGALAPDLDDKEMLVAWHNGESGITGETANPNFATGNRQAAVLADEFSKWEHDRLAYRSMYSSTNVILLVGTPIGYGNYYSEIACGKTKIKADIRRIHWIEHPLKSRGLEYINGQPTSEWYRNQCEGAEADVIAGELDLSFEGSRKGVIFGSVYNIQHQKQDLKPIAGVPILRCWDPGGWAVVIWIQVDRYKRVHIYRELVTEGVSMTDFVEQMFSISRELESFGCKILDASTGRPLSYEIDPADWFQWEDAGDPSGASTSKMNQEVPEYTELFEKHGINVEYLHIAHMPTEIRRRARIVAIEKAMTRPILTGDPGFGFWVDTKHCPILDEALRGGYRRKLDKDGRVMEAVEERHPYNDVCDALGYGVLYKLGIPESVKKEFSKPKSEEEIEDSEAREQGVYGGMDRC